jgi:hypothetical protein
MLLAALRELKMSYDTWYLLFLGTVSAMLLFNVIQWWLYQERVYGLYTLYMLSWIAFFGLLPIANAWPTIRFIQVAIPMAAYFIYFDLTTEFLNLRTESYLPYFDWQNQFCYCILLLRLSSVSFLTYGIHQFIINYIT